MEDINDNVFGGYISVKNEYNKVVFENHSWIDGLEDGEAFVFSLKSNNRLPGPMKFPILPNHIERCFSPQDENSAYLFGI